MPVNESEVVAECRKCLCPSCMHDMLNTCEAESCEQVESCQVLACELYRPKHTQINIQDVKLGNIVMGKEVVTIHDDGEQETLYLDSGYSIRALHGSTVTVLKEV